MKCGIGLSRHSALRAPRNHSHKLHDQSRHEKTIAWGRQVKTRRDWPHTQTADAMATPAGKTTIYDIARLAGASPSTVSSVLNGSWLRRRISEDTVKAILKISGELGYSINLQARGLRQAKSGLVGMIIPYHDNRFFSLLSQSFDTLARERGFCPVIASTLRDPGEERRVVETFISYAIDAIFIAGASDSDKLGAVCKSANLRHIFVDLPGRDAPSVITDNYSGAAILTQRILAERRAGAGGLWGLPYFLGGSASDYATAKRIEAFRKTVSESQENVEGRQIVQCGYAPRNAAQAIAELYREIGGLPSCLFVNSITALEGVMSFLVTLPPKEVSGSSIGCFDYHPFASFLPFPMHMIRQDTQRLIATAYELLDNGVTDPVVHQVQPELVEPRTITAREFGTLG
jgi:LacI family fructose operon transcriptional repressor